MIRYGKTICAAVLAALLSLTVLSAAGNAAQTPPDPSGPDLGGLDLGGLDLGDAGDLETEAEPRTEVGEITAISPSEALGPEDARSLSRATDCNQQLVTITYTQLSFTGVKKWCFDGKRVIKGTMEVRTNIKPQHKYTQKQDGWVYVPGALKKTDRFITHEGIERGAHVSTRQGRFELRIHGQSKPQAVYIPFVSRIAYGTGKCGGPDPRDLSPKFLGGSPLNGSKNVKRADPIIGRLSVEAKKGTANIGTFYAINRETGEYVDANTGRYTKDERYIVIFPYKPLAPRTTYDVTLAAGPYGVLAKNGDPLVGGANWSFTTGAN